MRAERKDRNLRKEKKNTSQREESQSEKKKKNHTVKLKREQTANQHDPRKLQSSPGDQDDEKGIVGSLSCQTYCCGFCGAAAAEARLFAASLAFSDASFTESLSGRWGASPCKLESAYSRPFMAFT